VSSPLETTILTILSDLRTPRSSLSRNRPSVDHSFISSVLGPDIFLSALYLGTCNADPSKIKYSHPYKINDTTLLYILFSDCVLLSISDSAKQTENKNFALIIIIIIIIIIRIKLQKYTDLKEELIRKWQLKTPYIISLVLYKTGIIPNKVHENLKLFNLRPGVHSTTESTNTEYMPYSENVFGRSVNTKCLVRETRTVRKPPTRLWIRNVDEIIVVIIIIRGRLISSKTLFLFADYIFS